MGARTKAQELILTIGKLDPPTEEVTVHQDYGGVTVIYHANAESPIEANEQEARLREGLQQALRDRGVPVETIDFKFPRMLKTRSSS